MAKVERVISAADGSETKIVAQEFFGTGLHRSVGVHVLSRKDASTPWSLLNDRPHPDWRSMSVDQYKEEGRSEVLREVGPGQILKTIALLGQHEDAESDTSDQPQEGMLPG